MVPEYNGRVGLALAAIVVIHIAMWPNLDLHECVPRYAYIFVCVCYICIRAWMYTYVFLIRVCVCMYYVYMHVWAYVHTVRMYIYIYVYIYIGLPNGEGSRTAWKPRHDVDLPEAREERCEVCDHCGSSKARRTPRLPPLERVEWPRLVISRLISKGSGTPVEIIISASS